MNFKEKWLDAEKTHLHLALNGKLLFGQFQDLQAYIFELKKNPPAKITFDLVDVDMIDSSGLGLLIIANEITGENRNVTLEYPNEHLQHLFDVCKFDEIMEVVL